MESSVNVDLLRKVQENVIGNNAVFHGPFGAKRLLYCDYTASGKALEYIERFICDKVYPYYANTHTSTSVSGLQTTTYREEAREIIRKSVNAGDEDVVLFTGSGTTAAIHKIISVLDLRPPKTSHTVVIIGPYEHHSNMLPWKETGVHMERILEDTDGTVDLSDLERHLQHYFHRGFYIIVTMSAASNVTGIVTDTEAITKMVHKYGGLAFWDFATAAPYLPIDMNPALDCCKDAVFISPHKFVGGVGTPGVLIAKKKLFNNPVPDKCGGGTVSWVSEQRHEYVRSITEREEGGTPAIVESIRAGLAFQVKSLIGDEVIMCREEELCRRALHRWRGHSCLQLLGSYSATRLPIFSFLVFQASLGKYLHHNFISVLLNDLFGIQVRGGCACAGPYAQALLEMEEQDTMLFVNNFLSEACRDLGKEVMDIMKPGFVRLNLPYFLEDECVEFILTAVEVVATEGWKLLPLYTFDQYTGNWRHREESEQHLGHLSDVTLEASGSAALGSPQHLSYHTVMQDARTILNSYQQLVKDSRAIDDEPLMVDTDSDNLMWFLQPREAAAFILKPDDPPSPCPSLPFRPRRRSSTYSHPPMSMGTSTFVPSPEPEPNHKEEIHEHNCLNETDHEQERMTAVHHKGNGHQGNANGRNCKGQKKENQQVIIDVRSQYKNQARVSHKNLESMNKQKNTANQGTMNEQNTANQGTMNEQNTANQGTMNEQNTASQGTMNEQKNAASQGTVNEQNTADQGAMNEQKSTANQGTMNEQNTADQGTMNEQKSTANQGAMNEQKSTANQGTMNEQNTADQGTMKGREETDGANEHMTPQNSTHAPHTDAECQEGSLNKRGVPEPLNTNFFKETDQLKRQLNGEKQTTGAKAGTTQTYTLKEASREPINQENKSDKKSSDEETSTLKNTYLCHNESDQREKGKRNKRTGDISQEEGFDEAHFGEGNSKFDGGKKKYMAPKRLSETSENTSRDDSFHETGRDDLSEQDSCIDASPSLQFQSSDGSDAHAYTSNCPKSLQRKHLNSSGDELELCSSTERRSDMEDSAICVSPIKMEGGCVSPIMISRPIQMRDTATSPPVCNPKALFLSPPRSMFPESPLTISPLNDLVKKCAKHGSGLTRLAKSLNNINDLKLNNEDVVAAVMRMTTESNTSKALAVKCKGTDYLTPPKQEDSGAQGSSGKKRRKKEKKNKKDICAIM